jgi:hypothetical protein
MCLVPDAPAPIQPRSAPTAPDGNAFADRAAAAARRRATLASMVTTNPNGMGSAPTAAKAVLGA